MSINPSVSVARVVVAENYVCGLTNIVPVLQRPALLQLHAGVLSKLDVNDL